MTVLLWLAAVVLVVVGLVLLIQGSIIAGVLLMVLGFLVGARWLQHFQPAPRVSDVADVDRRLTIGVRSCCLGPGPFATKRP
jgi:hypothetical protein